MSQVQADLSVRPAVAGDESLITAIQVSAWRNAHGELLGESVLELLDEAAMTASWRVAILAPPGPGYRVLVACAGPRVVGFAAVAPLTAADPEQAPGGLLLSLEVEPAEQRAGHGSRLLAAAVDLLRLDGADQLETWVLAGDVAREQFLDQAGLGPDGASRTLATGPGPDGRQVTESRWSATL
jgi:GNAT superfamily N-acetyltransferase